MNTLHVEKLRYDLPELEITELSAALRPLRSIEDANDLGELGDSFSIGTDDMDFDDDFSLPS